VRYTKPALKFLGFCTLSLGLSFLLFHVVWQPFQVYGSSMNPTLQHGDFLLVDRFLLRGGEIRRGDLAVFRLQGEDRFYIKRAVGLGGDTVEIREGSVWVNGRQVQRPAGCRPECDRGYPSWLVPGSSVFFLGDNLPASHDSRSFGPVRREWIYGRVLLCYLPFSHSKWLLPSGPGAEGP
jgi:signal peptidase I